MFSNVCLLVHFHICFVSPLLQKILNVAFSCRKLQKVQILSTLKYLVQIMKYSTTYPYRAVVGERMYMYLHSHQDIHSSLYPFCEYKYIHFCAVLFQSRDSPIQRHPHGVLIGVAVMSVHRRCLLPRFH